MLNLFKEKKKLKQEILDLKTEIEILKNTKTDREKELEYHLKQEEQINIALQDENKKLIDWVKKIIQEVGCYTVNNDNCIRIPIKEDVVKAYGYQDINDYIRKEKIHIPAIHFIKY